MVEMLINKYKGKSLDNLNAMEQVADDVCNVLSVYDMLENDILPMHTHGLLAVAVYEVHSVKVYRSHDTWREGC